MSKKYTSKQMERILKDILCNALEHMESILKSLKKYDTKDLENMSPQTQQDIKILNATLTIINDIVHPGHTICYKFFKGYDPILDLYVKNQALAFEKKLVPECYYNCCDPDGFKAKAKAEELRKKVGDNDQHSGSSDANKIEPLSSETVSN